MSGGIRLSHVTMRYGAHVALDDVSVDFRPGEIHAVIGPNGAGKSTLFGVVAGELRPQEGRVIVAERDVTGWPGHTRTRLGMARAFQVARIFSGLSVLDNIRVAALARGGESGVFWRRSPSVEAERMARWALETLGLESVAAQPARALSQGDKKRLELAMAMALRPSILLLDEPTAGMSQEETGRTVEVLRELWRAEHLTVVLTEHDMNVVFDLAHRVTVLAQGRVLSTGSPDEVRGREDVVEVYLGRSHA